MFEKTRFGGFFYALIFFVLLYYFKRTAGVIMGAGGVEESIG